MKTDTDPVTATAESSLPETVTRSAGGKKKITVCCDGTWNSENFPTPLTNVSLISRCITPFCEDGVPQIVYYLPGVGTGTSKLVNVVEGATGRGKLHLRVVSANCTRVAADGFQDCTRIFVLPIASSAITTPAPTMRSILSAFPEVPSPSAASHSS
jgi:hypothetical protein